MLNHNHPPVEPNADVAVHDSTNSNEIGEPSIIPSEPGSNQKEKIDDTALGVSFRSVTMAGITESSEPASEEYHQNAIISYSTDDDDDGIVSIQNEKEKKDSKVVVETTNSHSGSDVSGYASKDDAMLAVLESEAVGDIIDSDDEEQLQRHREIKQMGHIEFKESDSMDFGSSFISRHPCLLVMVAVVIVVGLIVFGIVLSRKEATK